jgi:cytochrome c-type biogenesis protein CcmH/NrfG
LGVRGAWLAAAVFALHPVNVESVAWITERKNTLSLFFFLLSLLLYLCSDQPPTRNPQHVSRFTFHALFPLPAWLFYGLSLFAFVLALFSKTAVAPLPVVLWLLAWWRRGRVAGRDVWRTVPFFTVALLLIPLTVLFEHHAGSELVRNDPFGSRLAGAGWAFWFYLYKAVLPLKLMFIYPRWRIAPADLLSYVPGLLVVAGFGVCWRYRRGWGRAGLFGLGYFLVMLLPALGFVNIYFMRYSLVSDHWQYFAIIGPIALAVAGLARALGFLGNRMPFLPPVVSAALLLALALLTWRQSAQYFDTETLWRTTIAKNPACWMAHNNLGILMITNRKLDDAVTHLREAIRINPEPASPWYNLAIAYTSQHHLDAAVACDQEALRRDPNNPKYLNDLAWIYATCPNAELRNGPEAVRLAAQACHLTRRRNLAMLDTLAAAFAEASQFDDAVKTTEELLARALSSHDTNTADTARLRLQLYQARTPYRDE